MSNMLNWWKVCFDVLFGLNDELADILVKLGSPRQIFPSQHYLQNIILHVWLAQQVLSAVSLLLLLFAPRTVEIWLLKELKDV